MKLQKLCVGAAPAQAGKRRAEDEESISKRRRGDEPLGGVVDLGVRHTCTQTHAHMLIHHAHGNTCTRTRSRRFLLPPGCVVCVWQDCDLIPYGERVVTTALRMGTQFVRRW